MARFNSVSVSYPAWLIHAVLQRLAFQQFHDVKRLATFSCSRISSWMVQMLGWFKAEAARASR